MPVKILTILEDKLQFSLGKGSGAGATEFEAKIVAQFIKSRKLSTVVALDVGANLGNWTAALLNEVPGTRIIAFEPSASTYSQLYNRFKDNSAVNCINQALGDHDGTVTLFSDRNSSNLASLTKRRVDHFDLEFSIEERVAISKLDTWIQRQPPQLKPNVLKMDVEGHELDVLKGAQEALLDIEIIQFEFGGSNIDSKTYFQDFWYFFSKQNFQIFRITPSGPLRIHQYSESDETFRTTNYIAVRT
jgi:FkbM family methyltransferase